MQPIACGGYQQQSYIRDSKLSGTFEMAKHNWESVKLLEMVYLMWRLVLVHVSLPGARWHAHLKKYKYFSAMIVCLVCALLICDTVGCERFVLKQFIVIVANLIALPGKLQTITFDSLTLK